MAFTQNKFRGASIVSFSTSVGWNEQSSEIGINLVEDPASGDAFVAPTIGSPQLFWYDNFKFGGIVQNWKQTRGPDGNPLYNVGLVSPTEILAGAQLIIGGSNQPVWAFTDPNFPTIIPNLRIPNLINVYGWWEDKGWGKSRVNEAGIPAPQIYTAIHELTKINLLNLPNKWGNPLVFRDFQYQVDLTRFPVLPFDYRIPGNNLSILDFINEVASDYGFDYFTELNFKDADPDNPDLGQFGIIRVTPVSRTAQLTTTQLTKIEDFVKKIAGVKNLSEISTGYLKDKCGISSLEVGRELRNEACTVFMVGGNKTDVLIMPSVTGILADDQINDPMAYTISPYYGLDSFGNFIVPTIENGETYIELDSRAVDVLGVGETYIMTESEMRFALTGQDEWESYVQFKKPDLAEYLGIAGAFSVNQNVIDWLNRGKRILPHDLHNTSSNRMKIAGNKGSEESLLQNVTNLYNYVKSYSETYYGKKYTVAIPFDIRLKRTPETNEIVLDMEPTDAGYIPESSLVLGLNPINEVIFQATDGRFEPFCRWDDPSSVMFGHLDPNTFAFDSGGFFAKCTVDPGVVFGDLENGYFPRAVINVPEVFRAENPSGLGPMHIRGALALLRGSGEITDSGVYALAASLTSAGAVNSYVGLYPRVKPPDYAAVPMKSNIETYGPWYRVGARGKTNYFQDESFVPWNFGGFAEMNAAASGRIFDAVTFMQEGEFGSITMSGSPIIPLGSALIVGGPNVTSINTSVGPDGVQTTYQMRTYTPRYGILSKTNADRWRRLGQTAQQTRRAIKQALLTELPSQPEVYSARQNALLTQRRDMFARSPHQVLFGEVIEDPDVSGAKRTIVTMTTITDAASNLNPDDPSSSSRAIVGLESLFRPISYDRRSNSFANLSLYGPATGIPVLKHYTWLPPVVDNSGTYWYVDTASGLNFMTAHPFPRKHDIEYLSVSGLDDLSLRRTNTPNPYESGNQYGIRGFALKTPIVLTGWGFELNGLPVPRTTGDPLSFVEDYASKPNLWKTGPLDVRWNENNGTWMAVSPSFPTVFAGTLIPDDSANYRVGYYSQGYKVRLDEVPIPMKSGEYRYAIVAFSNPLNYPLNSGARCLLSYSGSNGAIESGKYYLMGTEVQRTSVPCDVGCYGGQLGVSYRNIWAYQDNNTTLGQCPDPLSGVKRNTTYEYI